MSLWNDPYRLYKSIGPVQDIEIKNTSKGSTGTAIVIVPEDLKYMYKTL